MAYIVLCDLRFEWDPEKDRANQAKHGVSFRQASELFSGSVDCLEIYDELHSIEEDRFIVVGPIQLGVIVVVYTEHKEDAIRILSARKATRKESNQFKAYWRGTHER